MDNKKIYRIWFDNDWGELWLGSNLEPLEYMMQDEGHYNYDFIAEYLGGEVIRIDVDPTESEAEFIEMYSSNLSVMAEMFKRYVE